MTSTQQKQTIISTVIFVQQGKGVKIKTGKKCNHRYLASKCQCPSNIFCPCVFYSLNPPCCMQQSFSVPMRTEMKIQQPAFPTIQGKKRSHILLHVRWVLHLSHLWSDSGVYIVVLHYKSVRRGNINYLETYHKFREVKPLKIGLAIPLGYRKVFLSSRGQRIAQ